jgi:predicted nucleic acid-binding protein
VSGAAVDHLLLDASVLVELVVAGRHRDDADRLLHRIAVEPGLVLVTAAHGLVEAASALRGLVRGRHLTAEQGRIAVGWLQELELVLDPTRPRLPRLWELRDRMSVYDAAYAASAEALGLPLVTTDERLRRACADAGIDAVPLSAVPPSAPRP